MSNQSDRTVANKQSRKEYKQTKKNDSSKKKEPSSQMTEKQSRKQQKQVKKRENGNNKRPRLRMFPIWLRIIIVLTLAAAALVLGLMIGYGILGDGVPTDVLKKETWQHIIDIVTKVE
ncbi:DNA-directed RNA polymerase subunit beta [Oceanobacillus chungangensis]|uniref:DNA-directed RNA polymerase subunit beta n=1 Tax=Oceanobacillus chungangensis TaxID=1229152 RepID=A0A3D8PWP1_9BACI|nr:DNA-directed RNA polymerase subunit beta [Oceanobacillus chungangensis]RDW20570.1 DNA-directed RNA polymerase subunit beta [Oceanobacillus chungangensis]